MTIATPVAFFPIVRSDLKPKAFARLPISSYSKLNTSSHIPWISVQLSDRMLLCRAVPAVTDEVEYVEASSNLWIPCGDASIEPKTCILKHFIKKSKLAEAVEVEGEGGIDNFLLFMRANLVHKPICKGLNVKISLEDGKEVIFRVKHFICAGGTTDLDDFVIVAPQTSFTFVQKTSSQVKATGLTCPAGLEGPFKLISDLLDPKIIKKMREINVELPRGVLMSGPPGVGKTFLVKHIAECSQIPLTVVNGPELISPIPGESERNLVKVFEETRKAAEATELKCSIIFFDEIDAIARKREAENMEGITEVRVLTQLLTLMDGFDVKFRASREECHVIIFAATNRPNSLDPAMRRPGRFDREIVFEPPDACARAVILKSLLKDYNVDSEVLNEIGRNCIGFVSADLAALAQESVSQALKRSEEFSELKKEDFVAAMKIVGPSLHRQYQVALDNRVTWKDIAGIDEIRDQLKRFIEWPLLHSEAYARMGLSPPRGVLLYGPPGCSKTTIAKAIANESGFTFYSLNGAALYSCYIGESEQQIRDVFQCARLTSPSVIFFDEIDALVGKRSNDFGVSGGNSVQERILSTLLNEMDGITAGGKRGNVLVVGATNRKDLIDEALLRPGRFDKHIYIPPPTEKGRFEILKLFLKDKKIDASVDFEELARKTVGFTGADLKGLVQEAAILAMYDESFTFKMEHFLRILASPGRKRTVE